MLYIFQSYKKAVELNPALAGAQHNLAIIYHTKVRPVSYFKEKQPHNKGVFKPPSSIPLAYHKSSILMFKSLVR